MLRVVRSRLPRVPGCSMCRRLTSTTPPSPRANDDADPKLPIEKKSLWDDKELIRQLSILTGSQLILNLGYAQLVPVMPLFAAEWGGHLGVSGVGLVIAAPSITRLVLNVPLGRLCDTLGRVPLMKAGTALTAVGNVLTGFTGSLWTMLPCRLVVGAGSSSSMAGSSAYMQDLSDRAPEHRAKIMGLQGMVVGSVWVVGPAMGGFLAESIGLHNSFYIAGAGAALCSAGYAFLPETLQKSKDRTQAEEQPSMTVIAKQILQSRNQQALIALACVWPLRFSCFSTVVAMHATQTLHAGPTEIGVMYTVLALSHGLCMPLGSYLADKFDHYGPKKYQVVSAGLVSAGAFGSLAFATSIDHYYMAMALQGVTAGFMQPAVGSFTAQVTPSDKRGQAMSFQRQAGDVIALVGPIGLGVLADVTTCPTAIVFTSAMMAAPSMIYLARAQPIPPSSADSR